MTTTAQILFHHDTLGDLVIDNGLDDAEWTYGLNTQTFPTYGGEVVQILSVFIDDLTLVGTITTYSQMEAIYRYFTSYLQIATQGKNKTPNVGESTVGDAYNLTPVHFSYPARGWFFHLYPKKVPGFRYAVDVVAPTWQVGCFVVDDTPDMALFKDGLKALHATSNLAVPEGSDGQFVTGVKGVTDDKSGLFTISGDISPLYGDPNANPFETYDPSQQTPQAQIQQYADFYSSLIPQWASGDLSALTAGIGSRPSLTPGLDTTKQSKITVPGATKN